MEPLKGVFTDSAVMMRYYGILPPFIIKYESFCSRELEALRMLPKPQTSHKSCAVSKGTSSINIQRSDRSEET